MKRWIALCLLLTSCSSPTALLLSPTPTPTCSMQFVDYNKQIQPLLQEWDDAIKLASSTARISLAPQIQSMQDIRRRFVAFDHASCLDTIHTTIAESMEYDVDSLLAFMADDVSAQVRAQGNAKITWDLAFQYMRDLRKADGLE